MTTRIYYLVYNKITFDIIASFTWFNETEDLANTNDEYSWCNVTHPKNRKLLDDINTQSGTTY